MASPDQSPGVSPGAVLLVSGSVVLPEEPGMSPLCRAATGLVVPWLEETLKLPSARVRLIRGRKKDRDLLLG